MFNKKTALTFLKVIVSILLISYIASKIDLEKALSNIEKANYYFLFLTIIFIFLERAQLTYKWNLLIRARGIEVSFWRLFIINAIGSFWGLFLPSSIGVDVAKSYYLIKNSSEKSVSISSVFVDRILGVLALLVLTTVSLLIGGDLLSKFNLKFFVFSFSIFFLVMLYIFQREDISFLLNKFLKNIRFKFVSDKVVKLHSSILEYKKHPKTLFVTFILTVLVNITRVLIFYFISLAYSIPIPIIYFFIFIPILTVVIMIPISIGGLGLGEGAFITFFALVGISINDSIIIALTNTLFNTILTLLGGSFILFERSAMKKAELKVNNYN
ncbi:MAG: flippase-like domain-containing protein [Ignavibacteriales bacterium]|nr:flippase-like domain-containing protein [Ignavibacteriales bacterium]MCB9211008.1 flippase-like domain-containing protein [Ignavibacteriales bacterium]